jgi:outer membrane biosynthesis protein TonB
MDVRQYIRPDITASAIAHLSVLALVFLFTEVHPFGVVTAEPIAVDIVTPDEIGKKAEPESSLQLPSSDVIEGSKPASAAQPASAAAQAESVVLPPQQQPTRQNRKEAALQQKQQDQKQQVKPQPKQPAEPQPQPQAAQQQPPPPPPPQPAPSPSLGYTPPEPDLTIKYHVMLGLPEDMPVTLPRSSGNKSNEKSGGDGGDATASTKADVSSSVIEEFRRHLKTCSKLPAAIAPSDSVKVKLRVVMTLQGRLATDPILMEASASAKGPLLMQSAVAALNACQPYTMLPPDRYGEWKVIDLSFTPDDFSS